MINLLDEMLNGTMVLGNPAVPEFTPATRVEVMRCVQEQRRTACRTGDELRVHPNTVLWFCTEFARLGK